MSHLNGTVCTPEEQVLADSGTGLYCLTRTDSIGLAFITESGFISLVAVLGVFFMIAISLFASDLLQALGAVLDAKWVNEGKVYTGTYCTAQGAIQQLGETGVALATLFIAIHTFTVVIWGKLKEQLIVAYIAVAFIWLFVILFVSVAISIHTHSSNYYETPSYWCWIGPKYYPERISGEYFWFYLTMAVSLFTYIPLFLWSQGNMTVSPEHWWKIRFHRNKDNDAVLHADPNGRSRRSIGMIAYPVLYIVTVFPTSVVRFLTGFGRNPRHTYPTATFATAFLFSLSGTVNATLFLLTRPDLLSLGNTSVHRRGLGKAPEITLTESNSRPSEVNSIGWNSNPQKRPPLSPDIVLGAENTGWRLPIVESRDPEEQI
ncbi:hypothetical protein PILCRDRAFT_71066 [Piloderma croceum F 1598]|uniref:Uncharacterized protein n=1 Tax=Piloderma croceum (strain F 1598) TaxID=765440 RepID=A0A0C3B7N8_PILCF|nr:hypothetical protein PILCRDRAFT_71066 [Piloderma croceum F 1598]